MNLPAPYGASPAAMLRVARLDLTLLWRNRTSLFTVMGLPVMFTALLVPLRGESIDGTDGALLQGTGHLAFFLVFAVFMNLVTVFTARREDRTLKRLRGTSLSDADILGGSVLTATALYAAQAVGLLVLLGAAMGGRFPADPLLLAAGLAGGAAVFALLAFPVAAVTPTAELAGLTVLPIMFACMAGAGVMFPLDGLPGALREACRWLPLSPVVEIARTAYFGRDFAGGGGHPSVGLLEGWAECLRSFAVLALWAGLGRAMAGRWFRWEPRRG
ncbi:ABC transporter permease [Actinomadura litoris]|uniref:ABC transporter permease n=1 Tax=Actinomadura litoris TaxID=2678616 RepID=UPI001FA6B645|nr:ABC transporter permease [Actinomadura litoris]